MTFRANEAAAENLEHARKFSVKHVAPEKRKASLDCLDELVAEYGPVVDSYPSWHPLVSMNGLYESSNTTPLNMYPAMDHPIYLRSAFVTSPYAGNKTYKELQECVAKRAALQELTGVRFKVEKLKISLWSDGTTSFLVSAVCLDLYDPEDRERTGLDRYAVRRAMEHELKCTSWAECQESWESMRSYLLGSPCGGRSSLFVNERTGSAIKKLYTTLNRLGVFGEA